MPNKDLLLKLRKPTARNVSMQCHQMGVSVGDTIIGRETYSTGSWSESKLTLLLAAKQECVFNVMHRNDREPRWKSHGESGNWTLAHREWFKVVPQDK